MIVVGIDLSLTGTGIARITSDVAGHEIQAVTLGSKGKREDSLAVRHQRLAKLSHEIIDQVLQAPQLPDLVAIEAPAYSRVNGHQHDRSGLWWLVLSAVADHCPVLEVAPSARSKYATGSGAAGKAAVLLAVERRWPEAQVANDNEADAVVLAAIGARVLGQPIDPTTHVTKAVMKGISAPEMRN